MIACPIPYPKMKDSGVEWLGKVPAHWEVRRLKNVADLVMGQSPSSEECSAERVGLPFLQGCAEFGSKYPRPVQFCLAPAKVSPPGAILISVRAPVGRLNVADQQYGIGRGLCAIVPRLPFFDPTFCLYSLDSSTSGLALQSTGSTYDAVSVGDVACLPLVVPPISEQAAIVRYLDHVDRRIQRYIRAKQKLIALLEEQKQAVIHQAVTGQIDVRTGQPYPTYKPSGVDWLGNVPEHWRVMPLKWCSRCHSGDGISTEAVSVAKTVQRNIPVIGGNGIMGFGDNTNCYDAVLAIGRVGALCGNVHVVKPPAWVTDNALVLSVDLATVSLEFLAATLKAKNLNNLADKTAQPLITGTRVQNERIAFPPLPEQTTIALYLNKATGDTGSAINCARRQIDLLQEYRTRLIADVVTGKRDVSEAAVRLPDQIEEPQPRDEDEAWSKPVDGRIERSEALH